MKDSSVTKQKTIVVVGVGALGSHVVQFLRNEAMIRIVDFDRVDSGNLLSQFCGKSGIGKSKVGALKQLMQFLFAVDLVAVPHRLAETNVRECLAGADLVVDCLDNGKSRRVVQAHVRGLGVPCLHGALAADGGYGRVVWDEHFRIDDEAGAGAATCEGGDHLPFVALVSSLIARSAQAFLRTGVRHGYEVSPRAVLST